ncbi:MAG: hypothetical protein LBP33_04200 [Candidatus Adiutrix sp.]|jgi:hypothetical protein|nr:hypothetical protein [Candidatus Adiutrix sp.]
MTISRRKALLIFLLLLLIALPLAVRLGTEASLRPDRKGEKMLARYLGRASFVLPANFQVEGGALQLFCAGSSEPTSVVERPHPRVDDQAYELLGRLVPEGREHYLIKDLTDLYERPAQLIFSNPGPEKTLASVMVDLGRGSIRLSRPVSRAPEGFYDSRDFEEDARLFILNYRWGHSAGRRGDLHSLFGRISTEQGCRDLKLSIVYRSALNSVRLGLINESGINLGRAAAGRGLALAWPAGAESPPDRLSELRRLKDGQWNRKVRGGPRRLAGCDGLEWVVLRRDLENGRESLLALWRPDDPTASPLPALVLNADRADAAVALRVWDDLLDRSRLRY